MASTHPSDAPGLLTALVLSVFRLNGQLLDWGDHFAGQHGLTSARWQVLGAIALAAQPPSIPQIAAAMGVTRQGVLKQINLLAEEGMVEPQPNPLHKRSPLHRLTPRGQTVYDALMARWADHARAVAGSFTGTDLATAQRVLAALLPLHPRSLP